MSKYSPEQKAAILAAGRQALADAEATLDKPRPETAASWPPVEDKLAKWKREADEQAASLAAARAESLTEWEASRLERRLEQRLDDLVGEQKDLILEIVAGVVAELQDQFAERLDKLAEEIGQLRAEQTIAKAYNKTTGGDVGDVIDLPSLPLMRKRA